MSMNKVVLDTLLGHVKDIIIENYEKLVKINPRLRKHQDRVYKASVMDYPALLMWLGNWWVHYDYMHGKELLQFAVHVAQIIKLHNGGEKR